MAEVSLTIGLVEDDPDQARLICGWLEAGGFRCQHFASLGEFRRARGRHSTDLMLLDWELSDGDGVSLLAELRDDPSTATTPVIMLTVRADESDIVQALRTGADDYIIKPAIRAVLLARIDAVLRRTQVASESQSLELAPYRLDTASSSIRIDERLVELTQREFDLALYLFRRHGRIVSRETLLESVWLIASNVPTRTVDTHVSRLRRKLELDGRHGLRLTAVYQHGYRLEPSSGGSA